MPYYMSKAWPSALNLSTDLCAFLEVKPTSSKIFFFFPSPSTVSCSSWVTSEEFLLMPGKSRLKVLSVKPPLTNLKTQGNSLRLIFATDKNFSLWRNYTSSFTEKLVIIISSLVIPLQLHKSHLEKPTAEWKKLMLDCNKNIFSSFFSYLLLHFSSHIVVNTYNKKKRSFMRQNTNSTGVICSFFFILINTLYKYVIGNVFIVFLSSLKINSIISLLSQFFHC